MAANYVFSFSTADAAPAVTSTTPANGATNVAVNSNIVVNFSESVSAGGAVSISCTSSGTHSGSLSASPSTSFTFNPTTDFVANETCTVTVDDNDVTDTDTQDPPNNMAADYLFSFSTPDGAPIVVSTNPASGATGVSQTPTIIVRFNEPVDLGSWYMLQCTSSGLHTGLIGGGPAIWSLSNITPQLSAAETCTFTVRAAEVTDQDANDPPDNLAADYVFQFQVLDIAPSVTTTTPLDDATDVALNASVVVTFSEPVTVDTSPSNWIDVTCNSVSQAGLTSGGGPTWAFDPTNDLP
jgi:methionine-rich copper-binding protein CopC